MKITLNTFGNVPPAVQAEVMREVGYDGVDFCIGSSDYTAPIDAAYREKYRSQAREYLSRGIPVTQTHLAYHGGHLPPIGDGSYRDFAGVMLPVWECGIELTAELGCTIAVIHGFDCRDPKASLEGNRRIIEDLLPTLKKNGVRLAFENIFTGSYEDSGLSTAEQLMNVVAPYDIPEVGLCLDTGHALVRKINPETMLEAILPRLIALHMNSNDSCADVHLIPGFASYTEWTNWDRLADKLQNSTYSGTYNMELSYPKRGGAEGVSHYLHLAYIAARELLKMPKPSEIV